MTDTVISATTSTGVVLQDGDTLTVISGGVAIGTVVSNNAYEFVSSGGTASNTTVSGGYVFVGSKGATDFTTVSNGGFEFVSSGGVADSTVLSSGGTQIVVSGGIASGTAVGNRGSAIVSSGGTVSDTAVGSGGRELVFAGGLASGTTVASGGAQFISPDGTASATVVDSGGEEFVSAGGDAVGTVVSNGGTELIFGGGNVTSSIVDVGGAIDLRGIAFDTGGTAILDSATDILTVTESAGTYTQQLAGDYSEDYFTLASDNNGGTLITEQMTPCYCRGTRIRTPRGEVAVEELRIGDRVATIGGAALPLKWIGRRTYRDWLAVGDPDVQPIRFKAGSIADNVPARDLLVSPEHAMFLDGVLIPARHLVNGLSILKVERMEEIEYFHLEFDRHVVIFAESAAAESFTDDDSRMLFHNADEYRRLYPDEPRSRYAAFCAPRIEAGYEVEAVRRGLAARATRLSPDGTAAIAPLRGYLDRVSRMTVEGWAFTPNDDGPVRLAVLANGVVIGQVTADRYRADLKAAGIGNGRHGFRFVLRQGFAGDVSHRIEVRRESDWSALPGTRILAPGHDRIAASAPFAGKTSIEKTRLRA
jgi:autotransporter passenger strand-loop-strand repeat protein